MDEPMDDPARLDAHALTWPEEPIYQRARRCLSFLVAHDLMDLGLGDHTKVEREILSAIQYREEAMVEEL